MVESTNFFHQILIVPMTFIESYRTGVPPHVMPWPLKTYFLAKKPTQEKATSKKGKRYHVDSFSKCDRRTCLLHICGVIRFVWESLPKLLWLEGAVIKHIKRLPCILELCLCNPPHPILDNTSISSGVDDGLDFVDVWLIFVHVLWLVSLTK